MVFKYIFFLANDFRVSFNLEFVKSYKSCGWAVDIFLYSALDLIMQAEDRPAMYGQVINIPWHVLLWLRKVY